MNVRIEEYFVRAGVTRKHEKSLNVTPSGIGRDVEPHGSIEGSPFPQGKGFGIGRIRGHSGCQKQGERSKFRTSKVSI